MALWSKRCYVYHICRAKEKFNYQRGYIGVSVSPSSRWEHHKNRSENPHLINAIGKYQDIIFYTFFCSDPETCYDLERDLRPEKNIGWNINIGGSKPPSPKGTSNCISRLPPEKRRKNFKHSEETKIRLREVYDRDLHSKLKTGSNNPSYKKYGVDNPNFSYYYITPDGIFDSMTTVGMYYGVARNTILRRYTNIDKPIGTSKWTPRSWFGKTWRDIGWDKIGVNDMSYEELCKKTGFKLPRVYRFTSHEDMLQKVNNLPDLQEGFVLFDSEGEPVVKVKSKAYLKCHRLRGEGTPTPKRIMDLVIANETDEYLAIFPEDAGLFQPYMTAFYKGLDKVTEVYEDVKGIADQKEFAMAIKHLPYSPLLFTMRNKGDAAYQAFNRLLAQGKYKFIETFLGDQ